MSGALPGQLAQIVPSEHRDEIEKVFKRHPNFQNDPEEQVQLWLDLSNNIIPNWSGSVPLSVVSSLFQYIYSTRKDTDGPPVVWRPTPQVIAESHIGQLMRHAGASTYEEAHLWSIKNRDKFWQYAIQKLGIVFKQQPKQICNLYDAEHPQWLLGAKMNIVESVWKAPAIQPAVIWRDENETAIHKMTFRQLQELTAQVSNGLIELGYKAGDPIAVDMPMIVESVAIYLGIIQAGLVAVSIADSFSPPEIEKRLRISRAKGIFTVEGYMRGGKMIPVYPKVLGAHPPRVIVIPMHGNVRPKDFREGMDVEWHRFLSKSTTFTPFYAPPDYHTNILFSSGTTGDPKAIPWTHTTPIKAAADGFFHHDIGAGDVVCWPTNVGWMMGPWLIYQLINKATIALFYGAPAGTAFGKFVEDASVTMLGTIPTMVKSWMQSRCMEDCDWSSIRAFSSTGECSHPTEVMYLLYLNDFQAPMIEYCGGTEIGGGYITGTVVQDAALSTFSTPALGLDLTILDPNTNLPVHPGQHGELYISPPSMGLSEVLLNRDHHKEYFQGCPKDTKHNVVLRRHGDQMGMLDKGFFQALGRADDTMNLGGIKISSAELERCMATHEAVSEVAAIGVQSTIGQTDLVALVVIKPDAEKAEPPVNRKQLKVELQHLIRRDMNPLFKLYDVVIVPNLPKTASNKVMRRVLRDQYVQKKPKTKKHDPHKKDAAPPALQAKL